MKTTQKLLTFFSAMQLLPLYSSVNFTKGGFGDKTIEVSRKIRNVTQAIDATKSSRPVASTKSLCPQI